MAEIMEKQIPYRAKAWEIGKRIFSHENALLGIVLIALIAVLAVVTKGLSVTRANMLNTLIQSSVTGAAAIGQAGTILSAGIDLSVGGLCYFCATLGGRLMSANSFEHILPYQVPIYAGIPIVLLAGVGWGAINGLLITRVGVSPLIVTLGMWQILTGLALALGKGHSISALQSVEVLGLGVIGGVPLPIILFIVVAVLAYFTLHYTTFGRSIYAIGGNESSAWLSGIYVKKVRFFTYIISSLLAAFVALLIMGRLGQTSTLTGKGLEIDSIAAATVGGMSLAGGRGNIIGVILGILIIGAINNAASILRLGPGVQALAKGVVIFTAVAVDYFRRR